MANKPKAMSKLRKSLQLYLQVKSKLFISTCLDLSRNTVKKHINRFHALQLTRDDLDKQSGSELERLFILPPTKELSSKLKALYAFSHYTLNMLITLILQKCYICVLRVLQNHTKLQ